MNAQHTPGPWRLLPRDIGFKPVVQRGDEGGFIVQGMSPRREDADARLIAAAPDLLSALKQCRNAIQGGQPVDQYDSRGAGYQQQFGVAFVEYLDAAIAKATGGGV